MLIGYYSITPTTTTTGSVRLRGKFAEERVEHNDRLHVVPFHLRRPRSATF